LIVATQRAWLSMIVGAAAAFPGWAGRMIGKTLFGGACMSDSQ